MIKRLALLCCILLLPTIAAAATQAEDVNHGEWWVGGQLGGVFTPNQDVTLTGPNGQQFNGQQFNGQHFNGSLKTDAAFSAGAIAGYNFCRPYREVWERYFGAAVDFQWNQYNHPNLKGNQYALSFLARLQYPLRGDEKFTFGRFVPFLMAGPSVVWTESSFSNFGGGGKTSTNIGVVAEAGLEFFMWPHLSIAPSFRYRHVFGPSYSAQNINIDTQLDQFMIMGRLAYHF
jgi:opacity protein-like surface antigen